jgi:hypothetical protein
MKKKIQNENGKTFSDFSNKSWFKDGDNIKVGDNFSEIIAGQFQELDVKEILYGKEFQTWFIVITKDEKINLLKSSRELT